MVPKRYDEEKKRLDWLTPPIRIHSYTHAENHLGNEFPWDFFPIKLQINSPSFVAQTVQLAPSNLWLPIDHRQWYLFT